MAQKIIMPKQGLQMTTGIINKWLVSEGDFIENGTKIRVTQIEGSRIVVKKV